MNKLPTSQNHETLEEILFKHKPQQNDGEVYQMIERDKLDNYEED